MQNQRTGNWGTPKISSFFDCMMSFLAFVKAALQPYRGAVRAVCDAIALGIKGLKVGEIVLLGGKRGGEGFFDTDGFSGTVRKQQAQHFQLPLGALDAGKLGIGNLIVAAVQGAG